MCVCEGWGVFFKRIDVCIGGSLLEMRVVCYSLMHQHSTHLDLNPMGNYKTHTHTLLGALTLERLTYMEMRAHTHTHTLCVGLGFWLRNYV